MLVMPALLPIVISPPTGASSLPIIELDKAKVRGPRQQIRLHKDSAKRNTVASSFGDFTDTLDFTAWNFFHAAKKVELARSFAPQLPAENALTFAHEHRRTFIWNTDNFRKIDNSIFSLKDSAQAALAGSVGEAVAYLTMVKWGYVYWDHCASVWERAAKAAHISHAEQLRVVKYVTKASGSRPPANEPDYVFEKNNGDVALMEAKGSFVNPLTDSLSTKGDLRQALKQLDAWSKVIAPAPKASFGIGTYLRDENDLNGDPSLVAFVDPPGESSPEIRPVELPPDLLRRCNYGSWLIGMGLGPSGGALRNAQQKEAETVTLPVIAADGREYAVVPLGWKPARTPRRPFEPWLEFDLFGPWSTTGSLLVIGISLETLGFLEKAIQRPFEAVLAQLPSRESSAIRLERRDGPWSIMPDGTFVGMVPRDQMLDAFHEMRSFRL